MVPARPLTKLVWMKSAAIVAMSVMLAACNRSHGPNAAERAAQARAEAAFRTAQQAWRAQRVAELTKPDGWTSLIGLHLLASIEDSLHGGIVPSLRVALRCAQMSAEALG